MISNGGYLFVTFAGEHSGGEQIYFALSRDGLHWEDLNGGHSVLQSCIGEKGVRDPFLLRSHQGNRFYLLATDLRIASGTKWDDAVTNGSLSFILWESEDLLHWTGPRACRIAPDNAGCVWAPEAVYDPHKDAFMVFWSSFVKGRHRIYRAYTKDFHTFSKADIYLERPYDVIDMTIIRKDEMFFRFYKNEEEKIICMDCGERLDGEFCPVASRQLSQIRGVEGPAASQLKNGDFCLLIDQFETGGGYVPLLSRDLQHGIFSVMEETDYEMGAVCKRHGSVLTLSAEEYQRLAKKYGRSSNGK